MLDLFILLLKSHNDSKLAIVEPFFPTFHYCLIGTHVVQTLMIAILF